MGRDYLIGMPETVLEPSQTESNIYRPSDELRRKCRVEFVQGKGTGPQVAKRNKVSYGTLRQWAFREDWQGLKEKREEMELAKLNEGLLPAETKPVSELTQVSKLESHLKRIDEALEAADDSKDIVNLVRARGEIEEQLHLAKHGVKPGTAKTTGKQARKAPVQLVPTVADESQGTDQEHQDQTAGNSPPGQ